jgi:hypothetical protein
MNVSQLNSLVRSILKIIGSFLIMRGLTQYASWLNSEDVIGVVITFLSLCWSHFNHSAPSTPETTKQTNLLLCLLVWGSIVLPIASGCGTTPQQAAYQTAGTISISVPAAIKLYDVAASQGKTTIEQNRAVKKAYEQYQQAFALLCDAGSIYASTTPGTTTMQEASLALQQAASNSTQTYNDLINLITSFGVKL